MAKSAAQILDSSRRAANAFAQSAGKGNLLALLKRAQADLDERMRNVAGDESTFSEVEMRTALSQIAAISSLVKAGLGKQVLANGEAGSRTAVGRSLKYLEHAEKQFSGVATPTLGLQTAAIYEKAVSGTQTSILRRLLTNPADPRSQGILDRYGDAVVEHFEKAMQTRYVAGSPWGDVRRQLTDGSPFLQAAPKYWAERILRTETMYAQNRAGYLAGAEVNAQTGGVMLKILSCVFDDRTGADSFAVHGQIRRESESFDTWFGPVMHPPDRPNDRAVVVLHHPEWPIPPELQPKSDAEILARWTLEGRKGAPPPRPRISTFPLDQIGKPIAGDEKAPVATEAPVPVEPPKSKRAPTVANGVDQPMPTPTPTTAKDIGARELLPVEEMMLGAANDDGTYIGYGAISTAHATIADAVKSGRQTSVRPTDVDDVLASLDGLAAELRETRKQAGAVNLTYSVLRSVGTRPTADEVRAALQVPEPAIPLLLRIAPNEYVAIGDPAALVAAQIRGRAENRSDVPIYAHVVTLDEAADRHFAKSPYLPPKNVTPTDYANMGATLGTVKITGGKYVGAKARDALRSAAEDHGYRRTRGGSDAALRVFNAKEAARYRNKAVGFADWDGSIAVNGDHATHAARGFRALAAGKVPSEAERSAISTYVHETIHVHSPTTPNAYRGRGMVAEEVSTELLARRMTKGLVGTNIERGSYSTIIDPIATEIGSALGSAGKVATTLGKELLTDAADRMWRRRRVMHTADDVVTVWLDELEAVGVPPELRPKLLETIDRCVATLVSHR